MTKRIGIFGGTFDPPHLMHLLIAEEALEACELDQVWFLPSYQPPHVQGKKAHTSAEQRAKMVQLAIESNDRFAVNFAEIERKGKSYTVDTFRELKEMYPDDHFYFILGADMVDDLPTWHQIEELCKLTSFIAFKRPGYPESHPDIADVRYIDMPKVDLSSSFLRERLKLGRSCRYFLSDAVINYIKERRLYED
ncbi:nicotinate-nucleotide adenylyltransferase [Sporolactobacillus laevolacticus]|uniref:Probable nicotinate-nucleotide adenylyltransferase n=1 Tax=Sporolactobacillus laevolacticus DSM 442 TaxID=1395513 RepID=V6J0Q2_9BACL|nr:nicotinate-nucleotide adenylyltransferase [Sporolactobacillus laevolacticus]EST13390.1 nicotinate-nucleotide adenylyltransferase [Sporolactobacillus laevolacticus DSM 442]